MKKNIEIIWRSPPGHRPGEVLAGSCPDRKFACRDEGERKR